MKSFVWYAVLAVAVCSQGVRAQDPAADANCYVRKEKFPDNSTITEVLPVDPIPGQTGWDFDPAIHVHDQYHARGKCTDSAMDCWVAAHDMIWTSMENGVLVLSRKRGGGSHHPEYDAPAAIGFSGRFLKVEIAGPPARDLFLLPMGPHECPQGWYLGSPAGHKCRYFRVESFLDDPETDGLRPDVAGNWEVCRSANGVHNPNYPNGSAHEPPKKP